MQSYFSDLIEVLSRSEAADWAKLLPEQIANGLSTERFGDLPRWQAALDDIPNITPITVDLVNQVKIGEKQEITEEEYQQLEDALERLIPWRKGPYSLFGIEIDTEWRSDWKWDRLLPHIQPLKGRNILDVGCGNGYHCLRMLGAGAERVIGIDPSPRFVIQFLMLKKLLGSVAVDVLPLGIEHLPLPLPIFDTSFSMGVLYHRREPKQHIQELKNTLKPGGELVLETLIIDGGKGDCLIPEGRYAKMRNVWALPSGPTVLQWLEECGFENPRWVDTNLTSTEEQRSTHWMRFQSLPDFLDPDDPSKTVEGHPAPLRGIFVAEKKK